MLLYYDPLFLEHQTGRHPERPERLRSIVTRLEGADLLNSCRSVEWQTATPAQLAYAHEPNYIDAVRAFADNGGGQIEADTVVSPRSFDAAALAVGAACNAVMRVVRGEERTALCLVRPPGHHALARQPMGFCLFNNVAIAARTALRDCGLDRVLIVDWDVHHGNGTQDAFWEDERVGFLSIHRWPFWPGTGAADETGAGRGLGTTLNLPIAFGTPRREFLARFAAELSKFANNVRPQLVLVSAGFDAHHADPIGSLGLESEDFTELTQIVCSIATEHCGGRVVSLLEGGYDLAALAESVELHLRELLRHEKTYERAS